MRFARKRKRRKGRSDKSYLSQDRNDETPRTRFVDFHRLQKKLGSGTFQRGFSETFKSESAPKQWFSSLQSNRFQRECSESPQLDEADLRLSTGRVLVSRVIS